MNWKTRLKGRPLKGPQLEPDDGFTYWNGEFCKATKVRVEVGQAPTPTWWCVKLKGTIRKAVKVEHPEKTFFLDDEDGTGWLKVTRGRGSPMWNHHALPDSSVEVAE